MCFNRKLKKQISELQTALNELKTTIVTSELQRLREESKHYKEERSDLSKVRIKLKSVKYIDNGDSLPHIEVLYEAPKYNLFFNADGGLLHNDAFIAINKLGLLSIKDMNKLSEEIEKAKNKFQANT